MMNEFMQYGLFIGQGLGVTLLLLLGSLIIGLMLGGGLAFARYTLCALEFSAVLQTRLPSVMYCMYTPSARSFAPCRKLNCYEYKQVCVRAIDHWVSLIRGTPVILQLSVVYFVFPSVTGFKLDVLSAGIVAFGLNSSAYLAEVFRAGIEGIPKGQFEAARSLGISPFYLWKDIVLPQVFKAIWPALMNEVISLCKETALISMLGGMDLMRRAQVLSAEQFTYFLPLCIAGLYYYGLVLLIGAVSQWYKVGGYDANGG